MSDRHSFALPLTTGVAFGQRALAVGAITLAAGCSPNDHCVNASKSYTFGHVYSDVKAPSDGISASPPCESVKGGCTVDNGQCYYWTIAFHGDIGDSCTITLKSDDGRTATGTFTGVSMCDGRSVELPSIHFHDADFK